MSVSKLTRSGRVGELSVTPEVQRSQWGQPALQRRDAVIEVVQRNEFVEGYLRPLVSQDRANIAGTCQEE
jgi:hypothetical protein